MSKNELLISQKMGFSPKSTWLSRERSSSREAVTSQLPKINYNYRIKFLIYSAMILYHNAILMSYHYCNAHNVLCQVRYRVLRYTMVTWEALHVQRVRQLRFNTSRCWRLECIEY